MDQTIPLIKRNVKITAIVTTSIGVILAILMIIDWIIEFTNYGMFG